MKKDIFKIIAFVFIFLNFISIHNVNASSSGFVEGQIWYSKSELSQGDTVNIYTAVWNGDSVPLQARVEFYDKNVILGLREVSIPKETLLQVSLPWKITAGDHAISAKIISSSTLNGTKKQKIVLENNETNTDKQFVPVTVKTVNGENVKSSEVIANEIGEMTSKVTDFVPQNIGEPVENGLSFLENFRQTQSLKVDSLKKGIRTDIKNAGLDVITDLDTFIKNDGNVPNTDNTKNPNQLGLYKTENLFSSGTPLFYIKLFLLSALSFILSNKIIFYATILLICLKIISMVISMFRDK